jgi:hypothetical protein
MNFEFKITKWVRLSDVPSATSYGKLNRSTKRANKTWDYWNNLTGGEISGVYQVSLKKPKDVIHKDICYIGESDCLPKRISDLRSAAGAGNKVAHHMCGVYVREEGIDIDSIYVRCLIPKNCSKQDIERWLHSEHKKQFGYKVGYAWEEASGGYKSCRISSQMSIRRLNSLEACEKVQKVLNERIAQLKSELKK